MSADTNVADVRAFIERAWKQGDTITFDEFISPDFVGGRERFRSSVHSTFSATGRDHHHAPPQVARPVASQGGTAVASS